MVGTLTKMMRMMKRITTGTRLAPWLAGLGAQGRGDQLGGPGAKAPCQAGRGCASGWGHLPRPLCNGLLGEVAILSCVCVGEGSLAHSSYLLKRVAGVSFLQFRGDRDPLVVHLPVKGAPHGIPGLCLVSKVIVVNHINHRAHDGLAVPSDAVCRGQEMPIREARRGSSSVLDTALQVTHIFNMFPG